ncbi:MAG: hypothetical protein AB7Q29_01200 [Vicinamibacterales bacterium]
MKAVSNRASSALLAVALIVIVLWPPLNDRSLAVKLTNWAADPSDSLPILPPQFAVGEGDNYEAVEARDAIVRHYDQMYRQGGLMRARLEMKVATDPFNPSTERQLLLVFAAVAAFLVWRTERNERSGR